MTILGSKANIALEQQARKTPGPSLEPALFILVAGARYVNYMQIEIEPFPLVA